MSPAPDAYRPFAWAGLRLEVPEACRPFRIDGHYRKGNVGVADETAPRLELAWVRPRKRRFDPHRMMHRQLAQTLPREDQRRADQYIQPMESEHFAPLLRCTDKNRQYDRCAGFARGTGRVVELIVHFRDTDTPDEALLKRAATTLCDQRPDVPHQWAFFGHRFTTPAGFLYDSAKLNLGDMSVRLVHHERRFASLEVRFIYTAQLALQRRGLRKWLQALHVDDKITGKNIYLLPTDQQGAKARHIDTALGPTLVCDSRLRGPVRTIRWKMPRIQRHWLVHDTERDRLIYLRLGDTADRLDPGFDELIAGLDWADPTDSP